MNSTNLFMYASMSPREDSWKFEKTIRKRKQISLLGVFPNLFSMLLYIYKFTCCSYYYVNLDCLSLLRTSTRLARSAFKQQDLRATIFPGTILNFIISNLWILGIGAEVDCVKRKMMTRAVFLSNIISPNSRGKFGELKKRPILKLSIMSV